MRKTNIKGMKKWFMLALALLMFGMSVTKAEATNIQTDPLVVVDSYKVTNEKIVPGEDFTLTIVLKNYNMTNAATGVLIDIINPYGVAPVYGTVSQLYIGDIGPGESKEVVLDYNSWTSIVSDTLDFSVTIVTNTNQNYITLRVPAGSDSPFSILNVSTVEEIEMGSYAPISVSFEVLGKDIVKDVALIATLNGENIANSTIGNMTPGSTKSQQLLVNFGTVGDHAVDLELEYTDEAGQKQRAEVSTAIFKVVEKGFVSVEPGQVDEGSGANNILLLGVSGMLVLVIFLVVVIVIRKNN